MLDSRSRFAGALVVDAGNLLLYRKQYKAKVPADAATLARRRARAEIIAQAYARMGIHAVALGATDLVLGLPVLKSLVQRHRLPLMSANLQSPAGRLLFPAHKLVAVGGVKVGIFALTGEKNIARVKIDPKLFKLADPVDVAKAQVKALRAKGAQLVVALAAVGHQQGRQVAQAVPGIDFMFISGTGRHGEKASKVSTAWVMEMSREGKYEGLLSLYLRGGKMQLEDLSERFQIASRLERINKSIQSLKQRASRSQGRNPDYLKRRLVNSENSRQRMMVQLAKANMVKPKGSFFTNVVEPIKPALAQDAVVKALLARVAKDAGLKRPRGVH